MGEKDKAIYQYNGTCLAVEDWDSRKDVSFDDLVDVVRLTHSATQAGAVRAINRMQTLRNWIIGYYIAEFELKGRERAEYGEKLFAKLAERVAVKGLSREILTLCRALYKFYPQMSCLLGLQSRISEQIGDTSNHQFISSPESIISKLSFAHLRILLAIDDPPVGLLLCTQKGEQMVEYALAGMDNQLFVSTYQLQLPDKKTLEDFLLRQLEENQDQ